MGQGQRVFGTRDGEGVVIGPGRSRYFVRVRYIETNLEKEEEAFGLYLRSP